MKTFESKLDSATKLTREEMKKISAGVSEAGWVCFNYFVIGGIPAVSTYFIQADTYQQADSQCHSNCSNNPTCVLACGGPLCD